MNHRKDTLKKALSWCLTLAIAGTVAYGGASYAKIRSEKKVASNTGFERVIESQDSLTAKNTEKPTYNLPVKESEPVEVEDHNANEEVVQIYERDEANTVANESEDEKSVSHVAESNYIFSDNDTITWPVNGGIILGYSVDNTVWYKTLGQYKVNDGIVIGANEGDDIVAGASGVVADISTSPEYGLTITVDIGNGYEMIYGQIENSENLTVGSTVAEGDKIAVVAKPSRYFTAEGSNIFFKMTKDGISIDPMGYIEE